MKLTSLLTQYLYKNQRLDLPGLGTFLLDANAVNSLENSKQRPAVMEGISFENNPSLADSPGLVEYISAQTGKMKALAAADLDSHLQLAHQFLNIGKPFTFEGIGTLVKVKPKECEFIPISFSPERLRELQTETTRSVTKEEGASSYESFLSAPRMKMEWRKPVIGLLLLCGLGLAIWGGYVISKKAASGKSEEVETVVPDQTVLVNDSLNADSIANATALAAANQNYKYVLQVSPRKTAFKRYNQLKTNLWDVKMETKDSVQYKLFLLLPAIHTDTTRILDSLTVMTGKQVYIEHQN